jgi:hypothetical protein
MGHVIYRWKGILQAPKFQTLQLVEQKKKFALKFLSFRCPKLFGETRESRFKGLVKVVMVCLIGYDMIKACRGYIQYEIIKMAFLCHGPCLFLP